MRTFYKADMYHRKPKQSAESKKRRSLEEMTVEDLIKKLDAEVSLYVRGQAVIWYMSPYIPCFTCGARHHWKNMDAGHYIGREWYGTRWDLRNIRPQDTKCNCYEEGQKFIFRKNLVAAGVDVKAIELWAEVVGKHKPPRETLLEQIYAYREKNKIMLETLKKM